MIIVSVAIAKGNMVLRANEIISGVGWRGIQVACVEPSVSHHTPVCWIYSMDSMKIAGAVVVSAVLTILTSHLC